MPNKDKEIEEVQDVITNFLKNKGWKMVALGSIRIEQREKGTKKYKYEFVMDFIGKEPEEKK